MRSACLVCQTLQGSNTQLGKRVSDDYIRKIGLATENEAKLGLFHLLEAEYSKQLGFDEERAAALAGSVTDRVFGEEPAGDEKVAFVKANPELIEKHARELRNREDLCALLTGAAYNTCYARYLEAGGKRSMFSNPYLGYIRAGRNLLSRSSREIQLNAYAEITSLDPRILRPLDAMESLGILRPLPYSPNERNFYYAVHQFAKRVGVQFVSSRF